MKNNIIIIISLFLIFLFTNSCSTDLNINADYEVIPIVYCVLDPTAPYQYVKVNKAFLAEESAINIAQISDSLFFNNVNVTIKEYENSNFTGKQWTFDKVDTIPKEEGFFANDRNTIYVKRTSPGDFNYNADYELVVDIENGMHIVTGMIRLVSDVSITRPGDDNAQISLIYYRGTSEYNYRAGRNSVVNQVDLTFNYLDVMGSDTTYKSIKWRLNKDVLSSLHNNSVIEKRFSILSFYDWLATNIPPAENGVQRLAKMPNTLEFHLVSADDNYYTYSQVSAPSNGIVQHRPSFTNLVGGYGLFASRANAYRICKLTRNTLGEISNGPYTNNLGFVSQWDNYYHPYYPIN